MTLGVDLSKGVILNPSAVIDYQLVAKQRRPAEFAHEGLCKLVKRVRQNDDLEVLAQPGQAFVGPLQRIHSGDDLLDVMDAQIVLLQDGQALSHEFVVVGNVASGGP